MPSSAWRSLPERGRRKPAHHRFDAAFSLFLQRDAIAHPPNAPAAACHNNPLQDLAGAKTSTPNAILRRGCNKPTQSPPQIAQIAALIFSTERRSSHTNNNHAGARAMAIRGSRLALSPTMSLQELDQRMPQDTAKPIFSTELSTICVPITEPTKKATKMPVATASKARIRFIHLQK